jgi:hypothetical protein
MKIHIALLTIIALQACKSDPTEQPAVSETTQASSPSNRVAIAPAVRSNLGITFATAERRLIQDTLRAPGKFEYLPSAKREYLTMLPGKIELAVDQFDSVDKNTLLYTIDSPKWREIQQSIAGNMATIQQLEVKLETFTPIFLAHEHHRFELSVNIDLWLQRIETLKALREAGGGSLSEFTSASDSLSAAKVALDNAKEQLTEFEGKYNETLVALRAAKTTQEIALESASTMLNIPIPEENQEWWKDIKQIEVRATQPGIIESIDTTNGAWADEQTNVLTIVQPDQLRFHASGLQSDLGILRNGLQVYIVPPTPTSSGNSIPLQSTMHGTLQLGLAGDSNDRTIDLYVTPDELTSWARPGVSAQLEIVTDSTRSPELAIPLAAVQQDGLTPIIFRRNPSNPDEAIYMEADLGLNDGRWVAVLSGVADGDEIVLDGGFQLMLATSGSIQKGGHFHSDGTFHEGEH